MASATQISGLRTLLEHQWIIFATAIAAYVIAKCVYRRFFHPLANVPGPTIAAVTKLYQSYYSSRFYVQIDKLHQQYGPIVRITPDEVHLADADDYERIYSMTSKYWKSPIFYNSLNAPHSSFGTLTNEAHKIRRGAMNPMFSRSNVLKLEEVVQAKVIKACDRIEAGLEKGKNVPVDLHHIFRAVSVDVASEFAFDRCYDFLDKDDIGAKFFAMARGIGPALWAFQQLPALQSVALATPPWMAPYLNTALGYVVGMQMECVEQIESVKKKMAEGKDAGRQNIFTTLLTMDNKPEGYTIPSTWELKDEAYSVLVAAADTTGNAMSVAAFNVLWNPQIYKELVAELEKAFPYQTKGLSFVQLEKLPYLTAVIKEGLRLSFGVIGRLPRVVPAPGATFHGHFLPTGTIISMSSWMMHRNPEVFPDPMKFDPHRWLKSPAESFRLEHNMVPFGRGSRQCVGMPLAYTELYVMLGTFFRSFPSGVRPGKTTPDLMKDYEDFFSSYHPYSRREEWLSAYMEPGIDRRG